MKRSDQTIEDIRAAVRRVPRGRVATYGQIAKEAGYAGHPRLAGWVLANTPPGVKLPWHRVINAQGKISLPPKSAGYRRQKQLLADEGVLLIKSRVDLARYQWKPRSEAPVLD